MAKPSTCLTECGTCNPEQGHEISRSSKYQPIQIEECYSESTDHSEDEETFEECSEELKVRSQIVVPQPSLLPADSTNVKRLPSHCAVTNCESHSGSCSDEEAEQLLGEINRIYSAAEP